MVIASRREQLIVGHGTWTAIEKDGRLSLTRPSLKTLLTARAAVVQSWISDVTEIKENKPWDLYFPTSRIIPGALTIGQMMANEAIRLGIAKDRITAGIDPNILTTSRELESAVAVAKEGDFHRISAIAPRPQARLSLEYLRQRRGYENVKVYPMEDILKGYDADPNIKKVATRLDFSRQQVNQWAYELFKMAWIKRFDPDYSMADARGPQNRSGKNPGMLPVAVLDKFFPVDILDERHPLFRLALRASKNYK